MYDGTVSFLLSFDKITQKYIENIHIGKSGYAWVVSAKGIEISSPYADHIGKNVYDIYKGFPEIINMIDEMLKEKQGITTYHYNRIRNKKVENTLKYAVYLPIPIGNNFWSIVIATPEDELISSFVLLKTKLLLITIALLTIYAICIYYIVRFKIISTEQKNVKQFWMHFLKVNQDTKHYLNKIRHPHCIYERGTLNMLAVNNVFLMHYGYTLDEILKMRLTDLYPDDQKESISNVIKGLHGYTNVGEWCHRKKMALS